MRRNIMTLVVVLVAWIASSAYAQSYLAGEDLKKALIGKTLGSTTKRGFAYTITFSNTTTGIYVMKGETSALTLAFSNDTICFASANYKFQECDKVRLDGVKYDFVDTATGVVNNVYEIR